jgi:hypothetical protein
MAVTYSSLSTNSKNVYNRLHCWAITKVAIALHERKTANAMQLSRESGIEFPKLIDNCDVALLCQEELRTDTPLPDDIMAIKGLLKAIYDTENGGDKVSYMLFYSILLLYTCIIIDILMGNCCVGFNCCIVMTKDLEKMD